MATIETVVEKKKTTREGGRANGVSQSKSYGCIVPSICLKINEQYLHYPPLNDLCRAAYYFADGLFQQFIRKAYKVKLNTSQKCAPAVRLLLVIVVCVCVCFLPQLYRILFINTLLCTIL